MSGAASIIACCCEGTPACFLLFERCPCSPSGPPVAIPCSAYFFIDWIGGASEIVLRDATPGFEGVCFHGSQASPHVDPFASDPPLRIIEPQGGFFTLWTECEPCCYPPAVPCWKLYVPCNCNPDGGASGSIYIDCALDPSFFVKVNNKCYGFNGSTTNSLPPGAVVVTQFTGGFASCQDCCDTLPPTTCPTDCTDCPDDLLMTVPGFFVPPSPDCSLAVDGSDIPIHKTGANCAWAGNNSNSTHALLCCGSDCVETTVFLTGFVECLTLSGVPKWRATLGGPGDAVAFYVKDLSDCPMGTYSIVPGQPAYYPPTISIHA